MKLREILEDIYNANENERLEYALNKYSAIIPSDIVKYFFVRHCSYYDNKLFDEFEHIDFDNYEAILEEVSSEEIFTLIDYATECTLRDESKLYFEELCNWNDYWPNGTWSAPIVVTKIDKKLLALDGNNRLRMLRMFLKYSNKEKKKSHKIYLLRKKVN